MPFKSQAQARLFFAKDKEKAREWADKTKGGIKDLPEKVDKKDKEKGDEEKGDEEKKASASFMVDSPEGKFFRDLAGRRSGNFHKQALVDMSKTTQVNTGISGAPTNASTPGAAASASSGDGNIFGTGKGKKSKMTLRREAETKKLAELLEGSGPGQSKTAAAQPSDWDAGAGLPTGFHRPASEQPEALEAGGERFHSSDTKNPSHGTGAGIRHGLTETGGMKLRPGAQGGKHASDMRYLGTRFNKTSASAERGGGEAGDSVGGTLDKGYESLKRGGRAVLRDGGGVIQSAAGSAPVMGLGALILGRMALGRMGGFALRRGARGLSRIVRGKKVTPPTISQKLMRYLKS
jgi:hypothetical protein